MIRPVEPERDARDAAAQRLMRRVVGEEAPGPDPAASPQLEQALLEMERVWALAGLVVDDPRIQDALDADLARYRPAVRLRRIAMAAAAAVLLVMSGLLGLRWIEAERGATQFAAAGSSFSTGVGQRTRMTLADASNVALDTDSEIAVRMDKGTRNIVLRRGRAFFKVSKDPNRPFIVAAGDKRVRAVGTEFEVRLESGRVTVTVVEGVVEVTERPAARMARPGHSAEVDAGTRLVAMNDTDWALQRVDAVEATRWLSGRLSFMGEPLGEAVREMNRYATQKIVFRDGQVPPERVVGVFRAGDTAALAQAIELNGFGHIVDTNAERIEITRD